MQAKVPARFSAIPTRPAAGLAALLLAGLALPAAAQTAPDINMPLGSAPRPALGSPAAAGEPAALQSPTGTLVVTAIAPRRNLRNAPRTGPVAVTFSDPLNPTAATQGALRVFSAQRGGRVSGTATVAGSTLSFAPATAFQAGEVVAATISTAAQSTLGDNLSRAQVFQFTTAVRGGSANLTALPVSPQLNVGVNPFNLVAGDVDGDGDLDLVIPNAGSSTVSIRLNSGLNSTNFVAPALNPEVSLAGGPRAVALGDIDGDGDLDLVAAQNYGGNTVAVRLNSGLNSGNFVAPALNSDVPVGSNPCSVALVDVDGDGDLDLLTANNGDNTVSIRLNSGLNTGNFVAPTANGTVNVAPNPLGLAVGDVDGDGDLDLVTPSYGSGTGNTVSVRLNNGAGAYSAPIINPEVSVGLAPVLVTLADVDGDGDLDLLSNNYYGNAVSVRLNSGVNSGNFVAPALVPEVSTGTSPESLATGDVDGDGDLDLLTANFGSGTVSVRLNNGSGVFTAPSLNADITIGGTGGSLVGLIMGDFDGDGDLDFATTSYSGASTAVRLNQGTPLASTAAAALGRQVALYPNPAHTAAVVGLPAALGQQATQVVVLNALGQRVRALTLPATSSAAEHALPLAGLAPGLYTLRLFTAQGVVSKPLVVE